MNRASFALEFVYAGQEGRAADTLVALYRRLLERDGIEYFCTGEVISEQNSPSRGTLWAASEHPWFRRWAESKRLPTDPVVAFLTRNQCFVDWSHVKRVEKSLEVFEEAGEFGLRDGIGFAISLGNDRIAAIGIGMEELGAPALTDAQLHLATVYFVTRLAQLRDPKPARSKERLTSREKDVLRFLADGKRDSDIADRLRISAATARQHVSSAVRKLGARTRPQAVAIAVSTNQIRLGG